MAGATLPIHENEPQPGYYRVRESKAGPFLAVALWRENGVLRALKQGRPADAGALWTWCCRHPIAYELYVAVAERGEPWPDAIPAPAAASPGFGHNRAGLDPALALLDDITALGDAASDWLAAVGTITAQSQADKAGNFAEAFGRLEKQAEAARTSEKKPVLDEGRAIDAKWKPVVAAAEAHKKRLKQAIEPFLLAERTRLEEEARRSGVWLTDSPKAGTQGRRIGLRTTRSVQILDAPAFIATYRDDPRLWADPDVLQVLLRLAGVDLAAGLSVPGACLAEDHVAA